MENLVLFAGLPGVGKDTAASEFLIHHPDFKVINYSQDILKPIIEDPISILDRLNKLDIRFKYTDKLVGTILDLKNSTKDRELYIGVAQLINKYLSNQTNKLLEHFCLLGKSFYEQNKNIIIPSFRQIEEIKVFQYLFPNSNIYPLLILSNDSLRYAMLKKRDNKNIVKLIEEDEIEKNMTYNRQIKEVSFLDIIENDFTSNFKTNLEAVIKNLRFD